MDNSLMYEIQSGLAPVLNDEKDGIDPLKLGRIGYKQRGGVTLSAVEQDVLAALYEQFGGQATFLLLNAVKQYHASCQQQVDENGGTVVQEEHRIRDGQHTVTRVVKHFRPKLARAADLARREKPRARGTGRRPKAQATRSSAKSGDSGDEGGEPEPPPARRLCACGCRESIEHRAAQALYLNDRHADRDRQRRRRSRDRISDEDAERARACGCNGHHIEFEPGHCTKCGHWLPAELNHRLQEFAS